MTSISIIIPTITGREPELSAMLQSLPTSLVLTYEVEIIILKDRETCGEVWYEGGNIARGDYIYYAADDITFCKGWLEPLIEAVDEDKCPTMVVLNPDGSVQSAGLSGFDVYTPDTITDWMPVPHTSTPFMSRSQRHQIPHMRTDLHYCTDMFHSWGCRQIGIECVVRSESRIVHHYSDTGRLQSQRAMSDCQRYKELTGDDGA